MRCILERGQRVSRHTLQHEVAHCVPGGTSEERDVSITSAAQIIPALRGLGHEVFAIDTTTGRLPPADESKLLASGVAPEPPSTTAMEQVRASAISFAPRASDIRSSDVVFLALHGGAGEDGRLQAMLDLSGLAKQIHDNQADMEDLP